MDIEELTKYFGTSENMSGIRSEEQHIIMSFGWNKVNILLSILAGQKSVLNGMEKRFRGSLKGFKRKENIDVNICGVKAKGFAFEYIPESVKPINSKIPKCRLQAGKQSRKPHPHCT